MATVSNSLRLPDGSVPQHAAVQIDLVSSTRFRAPGWITATGQAVVSPVRPAVVDGEWSVDLIANTAISPSGTVYRVSEYVGRRRYISYISVGADDASVADALTDEPGALPSPPLQAHDSSVSAHAGVLQRLHSVDVRSYGAACDGVADDTTAVQAAIDASPGAVVGTSTIVIPGPCKITDTITISGKSVRLTSAGTGMGSVDRGALVWAGTADLPMLKLYQTHGCIIENMRFVGNDANKPSAAIEIADNTTSATVYDNESTVIRNVHIGPTPILGATGSVSGRLKRGVHIRGTTGNDRILMDNVQIFRVTECGIDNENPNSLWNNWSNVLIDGRGEYIPVGVRIGGGFNADNLNMLWVETLIDCKTYGHSPVVTLSNMVSEHGKVLLTAETEAFVAFYGGQFSMYRTEPGARIVDFDPMGLGGTLILEGVHFLWYQERFDGANPPRERPHLYLNSSRFGNYVRASGCRNLRHSDFVCNVQGFGGIIFEGNFVSSYPLVGGVSPYVGRSLRTVVRPGQTVPLEGFEADVGFRPGRFTTAGRPTASADNAGMMIYDTTLGKPIWSNGSVWKDAAGTTV